MLVVAHKVVSKAEGALRRARRRGRDASARATWPREHGKDPRHVQVILDESRRRAARRARRAHLPHPPRLRVRQRRRRHLQRARGRRARASCPRDPDASARALRAALPSRPAVVIADSFGRAWRHGQCDVAIGIAGLAAARRLARAPRPARARAARHRDRRRRRGRGGRRPRARQGLARARGGRPRPRAPRHRRRRSWRGGARAPRATRTCSSDVASVSPARRLGYGSPHESFQNTSRRGRRRRPHRRCRCRPAARRPAAMAPTNTSSSTSRAPTWPPPTQAVADAGGKIVSENRRDRRRHRDAPTPPTSSRRPREQGALEGAAVNEAIGQAPDDSAKVRRDAIEKPAIANQRGAQGRQEAAQGRPAAAGEPLADKQWDMRMMGATPDGSYSVQQGSHAVRVGIIDTGIDGSHPDIAPNFDARAVAQLHRRRPDHRRSVRRRARPVVRRPGQRRRGRPRHARRRRPSARRSTARASAASRRRSTSSTCAPARTRATSSSARPSTR